MYLENIRKLVKESGLKRKYVARVLEMKYDTFRRKLNGETEFKISEVVNLCKLLNINILEVFKDENSKI
jgi:ribosome-binding protein aMBF1 (putative translation factor)